MNELVQKHVVTETPIIITRWKRCISSLFFCRIDWPSSSDARKVMSSRRKKKTSSACSVTRPEGCTYEYLQSNVFLFNEVTLNYACVNSFLEQVLWKD